MSYLLIAFHPKALTELLVKAGLLAFHLLTPSHPTKSITVAWMVSSNCEYTVAGTAPELKDLTGIPF